MSSIVRSVLGAALLISGAPAAMAASDSSPAGYQSGQTSAAPTVVAANTAPAAEQSVPTGAYAASSSAPVAEQSTGPLTKGLCDKADLYGGHAPASHWGTRAFWDGQSNGQ